MVLAGAVALPLALPSPALAGLSSYDVSGKGVLEARMDLGDAENAFVFSPNELTFEQGRVYKLTLANPSTVEHYFTCVTRLQVEHKKSAVTELCRSRAARASLPARCTPSWSRLAAWR